MSLRLRRLRPGVGNALCPPALARMCDPKELRARASKLLAFALSAKELGIEAYAMALMKLAHEVLAEAERIEGRAKNEDQK